jgi:hypothetical protein
VKDYQLVQKGRRQEHSNSHAQLSQYSQHFAFIASHLLQTSMDSHCPEAVEATWVLSLALKGLYKTLKVMVSLFHLVINLVVIGQLPSINQGVILING